MFQSSHVFARPDRWEWLTVAIGQRTGDTRPQQQWIAKEKPSPSGHEKEMPAYHEGVDAFQRAFPACLDSRGYPKRRISEATVERWIASSHCEAPRTVPRAAVVPHLFPSRVSH